MYFNKKGFPVKKAFKKKPIVFNSQDSVLNLDLMILPPVV